MNQTEILKLFTNEEKDILFDIPMSNDTILNRKEYRFLLRILDTEYLRSEYNWSPDTFQWYAESNARALQLYQDAGMYRYFPIAQDEDATDTSEPETWTAARDLNHSWTPPSQITYGPLERPPRAPVSESELRAHAIAHRAIERARRRRRQQARERLHEHEALIRLREIEAIQNLYQQFDEQSDTE